MFVHQSRLRHLLRPKHYRDPEHDELELETLFRTTWQFACTKQEIARKGDFVTLNLAGTPVILRNFGDLIFINISDRAETLKEFIGEKWDEIEENFQAPMWRMAEEWEFDVNSNWKVPVENTLDSYHIAEVHPHWFEGGLPLELHTIHHLGHVQLRVQLCSNFTDDRPNAIADVRVAGNSQRSGSSDREIRVLAHRPKVNATNFQRRSNYL